MPPDFLENLEAIRYHPEEHERALETPFSLIGVLMETLLQARLCSPFTLISQLPFSRTDEWLDQVGHSLVKIHPCNNTRLCSVRLNSLATGVIH